tara:strand:- start:766 stop:1173 length:408 start_codon:yes stop_codon:yes gene_type:complete
MNKLSYKILFYFLLFFLLIKNIYYINIEKFENIFIFFITYILCYFFIDNNLIKILLCIIIPDILYFKPVIEGAGNMSNLRKDIKEQGGQNLEENNEKKEKENEKLSEEKDENKVDKKGFEDPADSDESDFENLVS